MSSSNFSSIGKVEPDEHRLAQQISACGNARTISCLRPPIILGSYAFRSIGVVFYMQRNIGPVRLVDEISRQERMGVDVIVVFGKCRIALPVVSDEVIAI
jgi:hypothetical protein